MEMRYIDRLIVALNKTVITDRQGKNYDYDTGEPMVFSYLSQVKKERTGLFICGNGGSAGIAVHMTADYLKNGGFNVRSMYNPSVLTCIGNDLDYDHIFSKQLELMATVGDTLIAISSSGRSDNILKAIYSMKECGGRIITFTGFDEDNPVRRLGDLNIYVPIKHYGMVESIHNLILQQIVDEIVDRDGVALSIEDDR